MIVQLVKYKTGLSDEEAYRVEGEPRVEIFEVVSILRAEQGIAPTS